MATGAHDSSRSSRHGSPPSLSNHGHTRPQLAQRCCTRTTTKATTDPLPAAIPTRLASSTLFNNPCLAPPGKPAGRTAGTLIALGSFQIARQAYTVKSAGQHTPLAARAASTATHRALQTYQRCAGGGVLARSRKGTSLARHHWDVCPSLSGRSKGKFRVLTIPNSLYR